MAADQVLVPHRPEDGEPPALGRLGVDPGAEAAGGGDGARQERGLGQGEVGDGLSEVRLGGGADAVGAVTEVGRVQVAEEDLVLGQLPFEPGGDQGLPQLAGHVALTGRVGVLDVLLGDGRAALDDLALLEVDQRGPDQALGVDALVLPEALVLDGDDRVLHHLGDVPVADGHGQLEGPELGDLVAVGVHHHAGVRADPGVGVLGEVAGEVGVQQGPEPGSGTGGHGDGREEGRQHDDLHRHAGNGPPAAATLGRLHVVRS